VQNFYRNTARFGIVSPKSFGSSIALDMSVDPDFSVRGRDVYPR
jgi:hypothetical protein